MKKITKIAALAALNAMFFAGCSNITDGSVEGTETSSVAEQGTLSIEITSASSLIDFSDSNSRTILPDAHNVNSFKFYLSYQDLIGSPSAWSTPVEVDVTPIDSTNTSEKKGIVAVNLAKSNYNLHLFAIKTAEDSETAHATDEALFENACLMGTAAADLRYNNAVSFYLTSDGLTKKGSVALKLYAAGWELDPADYEISAHLLYTKTVNDKKEGDEFADTLIENITLGSTAPDSANYSLDATVAPGTYDFVLSFVKDGITFEWNDRIIILPGQTTARTIGIPQVVDTKPAEPASFKAGYIDNKDTSAEFYDVEFTWDAADVKNEKNFEIEWVRIPASVEKDVAVIPTTDNNPVSADKDKDDEAWNALLAAAKAADATALPKTYGTDFVGDLFVYSAGSLGRNKECATFKAAYGSRYAARIRAVNNIGDSDWVYVTLVDNIAEAGTDVKDATAFPSTLINRYKVSYELDGGKFYTVDDDGNPTTTEATIATVYYESEDSAYTAAVAASGSTPATEESGKIAIMQPDGKTAFSYNYLVDDTYGTNDVKTFLKRSDDQPWYCWYNGTEIYDHKYYGGSENLILKAGYKIGTLYVYDDNEYAIKAVESEKGEFVKDTAGIGYSITYSQSSVESDTWTVTYPEPSYMENFAYDKVTLRIQKTNNKDEFVTCDFDSTAKTFTIPVKALTTGVYNAVISAYTSAREKDPYTVTITVTVTD